MQEQHSIGLANLVPRAGNSDTFDFVHIGVIAQACGVHHMQRHALNLNRLLHHISRGAGNGRDDGQLGACQCVEQRAFARVRLTRNDHANTFAQQRALFGLCQHACEVLLQTVQLPLCVGLL